MAKFIYLPQFTVYKKGGALQLELTPALEDGKKIEKGFAMLTMAKSTGSTDERGNPTYNWKEDRIVMKMNDKDLMELYLGLVNADKRKIIHDPNAGTGEAKQVKSLSLEPGKTSGMFISMYFQDQKASLPLDDNEIMRLRCLIQAAIPAIYGWDTFMAAS